MCGCVCVCVLMWSFQCRLLRCRDGPGFAIACVNSSVHVKYPEHGWTHTIVGTQENNAPTLWNVVVVVVDRSYIFSFWADSLPV